MKTTRKTKSERLPASDGSDGLASRWTEEQHERARCIVNDIAEDIDNGESRTQLREALAIYADLLWDAGVELSDKRSNEITRLAESMERLQSQNAQEHSTSTADGASNSKIN